MARAPAFLLYANDFFVDTITWELDELGLYSRLLFVEWTNGPLDNDPKRLAKIAGTSLKKFNYLFKIVSTKFTINGEGYLINIRLEETRKKQANFIELQRNKGKISAGKRATAVATTVKPGFQPEANLSISSSISDKDIALKATPEPFRLPSKEEIENSSKPLTLENIDKATNELYEKKIWLKVHSYKNAMLKRGCNERAILKSLMQCLIKKPENPWAYCAAIMKKEDGNFNARDYEKNHG